MNRRELKAQLKAQKRAARAAMAESKARARAQLAANPAVQRERRKRQLRQAAGLTLLLLLLLFIRCDCSAPPGETIADGGVDAGVALVAPLPPKPKPKPKAKAPSYSGKIDSLDRGGYEAPQSDGPSWLDAFRIQVAARSPRLAECFQGTDRPGALRWTSSVNAERGTVSDHELESLKPGFNLSSTQWDCVTKALANPPYKLESAAAVKGGLPNRVSIVIEF